MTLKLPAKFDFDYPDFEKIGGHVLGFWNEQCIQPLIKPERIAQTHSTELQIQNWFPTLPSSVCYHSVGITGIIFPVQMETSVSNALCRVVRFTGLEAPVRCKSKITEIQREDAVWVGKEVEYSEKSSWHRGLLTARSIRFKEVVMWVHWACGSTVVAERG